MEFKSRGDDITPATTPTLLQHWDCLFRQTGGATRNNAVPRIYEPTPWKKKIPLPARPYPAVSKTRRNSTAATYFWGCSSKRQEEKCRCGQRGALGGVRPTKPQGGLLGLGERGERGGGHVRLVVMTESILGPSQGWWW